MNEENENLVGSAAIDLISDAATGVTIPAPIRKNAFKAFNRLCTAAIDIAAAYLEGIAEEKKAETNARIKLIETNAEQIADQLQVDPEYARIAVKKFGQKIIREQVNLDIVSEKAAKELSQPNTIESEDEIDDDWLNTFEKEASQKSTEDMQALFARVLSGEITRPSTYSIRTVKILGEINPDVAQLFQRFCSAAISVVIPRNGVIYDGRVCGLSGNAASNSLKDFGITFGNLNTLNEYGLIISDYNSWFDYSDIAIIENNRVKAGFYHQDKLWGLKPMDGWKKKQLKITGVALSKAGQELSRIVDISPHQKYTDALIKYFSNLQLEMVRVNAPPPN